MTPKKRPYKPKIKGCYECSQRRVNCDRAEPQCKKCTSRGIKCSGLGIRHRFNNGVASRGKWAGMSVQRVYGGRVESRSISCHADSPCRETGVHPHGDPSKTYSETSFSENLQILPNTVPVLQPSPDNVPSWKRLLFHHFSEHIAKEMVAIDGPHNGWRCLVLPVAQTDELVMSAVLAVSAFHLSLTRSNLRDNKELPLPSPEKLYTTAIDGLQQRRDLRRYDRPTQQTVLLSILVLLVAVMVNGSSDFPTMFRALESALEAINGEVTIGVGDLADFLRRQIHKLRAYAAPLLSEQAGLELLSSQVWDADVFSCLNYCFYQQPQHAVAVSYITELVHQAHDIYLHQAASSDQQFSLSGMSTVAPSTNASDSIIRVQRFKEIMEWFPHDSPGEQVLIWASFIAASDCVLTEHKAFFEDLFKRYYERSGFLNVLRGLQLLRKIWARGAHQRWTALVPQAKLFIM